MTDSTNNIVLLKTNFGDIKIELDYEKAPLSAKNFEDYVKDGFYDGTIFHRVITHEVHSHSLLGADEDPPWHSAAENAHELGSLLHSVAEGDSVVLALEHAFFYLEFRDS